MTNPAAATKTEKPSKAKKAEAAAAPAAASTNETESTGRASFVVASKVKDYVRSKEKQCGGDLCDALSAKVIAMLDEAIKRATENGRATVRGVDA